MSSYLSAKQARAVTVAATLLAIALILSGCAKGIRGADILGQGLRIQPNPDDPVINVYFDEHQCPRYVDYPDVILPTTSGVQKLTWRAIDMSNGEPWDEPRFKLYWDPFVGQGNTTSTNGVLQSQPLDGRIPADVRYKYTIAAVEGNPAEPREDCMPHLDPGVIFQPN